MQNVFIYIGKVKVIIMNNSFITESVRNDLCDPNSPYYLGQPSTIDYIQQTLRGMGVNRGRCYNTNYLGSNKRAFLAQPQVDTFMVMKNAHDDNIRNNWMKFIVGTTVGLASLFVFKKIPGLNLIPKAFGHIISSIGSIFK